MNTHEILNKLSGVKNCGNGKFTSRCPAHEDHRNSLSISEGSDGKPLLYCHAGCSFDQIISALNIGTNGAAQVVATYDYLDERGNLLFQVCRTEPKGFFQRIPGGKGGWINKLNGTRRVLYGVRELLLSSSDEFVYTVEGEKDVEYLKSLGLIATTNAGGAGKWRNEYNEYLAGRHVVILPDNDDPGRAHAEKVAEGIYSEAASVRIVNLPDLPPKGDVSDWLDGGWTHEQLKTLATEAPLWTPKTASKPTRSSSFTFTTLDDLLSEPEEETAYVWDKTLPRGGFSICSAKPKVGKSTLARNLAVAISQGVEFFGRATVKGTSIYLCLEEKRGEVARHFRRMQVTGSGIIIHTGSTPTNALEALEIAIKEHSPALVIIDPLSRFVRVADFNSYGEVTRGLEPLIDLARSSDCQCHIMAVHHNGKGEREGGDALLGSTGFFGAVDTLLTMKRRDKARTLETLQRYGEDMPETVVHLDAETGLVTPGGDMQTLQLNERKAAVLESLGDEPLAEADIKERICGNQGLTSKAVRSLYEEGRLLRTGAGKKGDPYRYQRQIEPLQNPNENSRYSGFPIYTDPENLENPESETRGVITPISRPCVACHNPMTPARSREAFDLCETCEERSHREPLGDKRLVIAGVPQGGPTSLSDEDLPF